MKNYISSETCDPLSGPVVPPNVFPAALLGDFFPSARERARASSPLMLRLNRSSMSPRIKSNPSDRPKFLCCQPRLLTRLSDLRSSSLVPGEARQVKNPSLQGCASSKVQLPGVTPELSDLSRSSGWRSNRKNAAPLFPSTQKPRHRHKGTFVLPVGTRRL